MCKGDTSCTSTAMEDMKSENSSSLLFFFLSSPRALASASLSAKKPGQTHSPSTWARLSRLVERQAACLSKRSADSIRILQAYSRLKQLRAAHWGGKPVLGSIIPCVCSSAERLPFGMAPGCSFGCAGLVVGCRRGTAGIAASSGVSVGACGPHSDVKA